MGEPAVPVDVALTGERKNRTREGKGRAALYRPLGKGFDAKASVSSSVKWGRGGSDPASPALVEVLLKSCL